jgi:dTDP-4-dehydrorhamnose reductase
MTGQGEAVWAGLADEVFAEGERFGRKPVRVKRMSTSEYPTPAKRPKNSRLDSSRLHQTFGLRLPDWRASTRVCVQRFVAGN